MKIVKISLIVCTRNRVNMLDMFLQSTNKYRKYCKVEILVIDNASTDGTQSTTANYPVNYQFEPQIGLSHARNRGAKEAEGGWLCYIDDDSRLQPGYIERALWVIENFDFDCFGGMYYAWFPFGKPNWIDESFGTKIPLRETVGPIEAPELSGGNFLIKKEVLKKAGGFPVDFGMAGTKIGYGEEDFLQRKLLDMGYKLGFDPELKIDHAVLPHKLKLSWHLQSWYAHGRDGQRFSGEPNLLQISWLFFRSFFGGLIKMPIAFGKLIVNKRYYWQNMVWDVVSPILFRIGQIVGTFK